MPTEFQTRRERRGSLLITAALFGAACLLAAALWYFRPADTASAPGPETAPPAAPAPALAAHEVLRDALELRDGRLHLLATGELFTGTLVERYTSTAIRARIEIREGRVHGVSRGWYDTGEPEVHETFVEGRSHGLRTRWYKNGRRRSEAEIRDGQLDGRFREWHENGLLAAEMSLAAGKPVGSIRRWTATGEPLPDLVPPVLASKTQ